MFYWLLGGGWFGGNTLLNFSQCKGMRGNEKGFFNYYNIIFKKNQEGEESNNQRKRAYGKWWVRVLGIRKGDLKANIQKKF